METYGSASSSMPTSFWVGYLIVILIIVASLWKIFTKAGKPGWASLIPIYNLIVLLEIIGKPIWWFLLMLIPCVNFVFGIWTINLLSKSFGKGVGFTLGLIFLPFIFYPILAFGDATYQGPGGNNPAFGADDYQKPFDITPNN